MRGVIIGLASLLAVSMLLAAVWGWRHAGSLPVVLTAGRQDVMAWSVRTGAVALAALAQWVVLQLVVGNVYARDDGGRRDGLTLLLHRLTGLCFVAAAAGAVALGLAAGG